LYWDHLASSKNINYDKKANNVKDIAKHIIYCIFHGVLDNTTGGHWTLIVWYKHTHGKVAFYHIMDSLNNFDNIAPYALSNTPLYSHNIDSWYNVKTVQ
jgi:hypothetical protein